MVVIKVTYGKDIRRVTAPEEQTLTFKDLRQLLRKLYHAAPLPTHFEVKYLDDENDQVTISSDHELADAFHLVRNSPQQPPVLRLTIQESSPKASKAAPASTRENPSADKGKQTQENAFTPAQLIEVIEAALSSPEVQQTWESVQGTFATCVEQAVREGRSAAHYVQQHPQFARAQHMLTERLPQAIHNDLNTTIPQLIGEIQNIFANVSRPQAVPASNDGGAAPASDVRHHAICDSCDSSIVGVRYKCSICPDYDLCETCEAKPGVHDPTHYFLKLRAQLPWNLEHTRLLQQERPSRCPYFQTLQPAQQAQPQKEENRASGPQFRPRTHQYSGFMLSSRFVSDVSIEDGTVLPPNTPFVKVWRIHNDGELAWPEGTTLNYIFGTRLAKEATVSVPALPVGEEVDVAVEMVTPAKPGHYESNWRLAGPRGYKFGHRLWADITVQAAEEQKKDEQEEKPADEVPATASSYESDGEFEVIEKKEEEENQESSAVAPPSESEPEPEVKEEKKEEPSAGPVHIPIEEAPAQPQEEEEGHVAIVLDQLQQMGFQDRALNKRLLFKNKGNVLVTVHQLLDM